MAQGNVQTEPETQARIIFITGDTHGPVAPFTGELHRLLQGKGKAVAVSASGFNSNPHADKTEVLVKFIEKYKLGTGFDTVLVKDFYPKVGDIGSFVDAITKNKALPQKFYVLNVQNTEPRHTDLIVAEYANELARDKQGGAGTLVFRGSMNALLAGALKIITGDRGQVTICGTASTGKSTLADAFQYHLGYRSISSGQVVADRMAVEYRVTLDEMVQMARQDSSIPYDKNIDAFNKKTGEEESDFAIDSRLGALFIPGSFKIYAKCPLALAAERVIWDQANNPEKRKHRKQYVDVADAIAGLGARDAKDKETYIKLYDGWDFTDANNYHSTVDSGILTKEQMIEKCLVDYVAFLLEKLNN